MGLQKQNLRPVFIMPLFKVVGVNTYVALWPWFRQTGQNTSKVDLRTGEILINHLTNFGPGAIM